MDKWADYGIARVKYNGDRTAIAEVEVRADLGTTIGSAEKIKRSEVVGNIDRGLTYVTILSRDGKWSRGADVRVRTIHGQRYIRTDNDSTKADNLGELPEYT